MPFQRHHLMQVYNQLNQDDKLASEYLPNKVAKVAFNIFLQASYTLFAFGVFFTFESASLNQQKIVTYIQSPGKIGLFIFIAFLGILILVILKEIKEENDFQPRTNKFCNFLTDILRAIFYFLALFWVKDFIFENGSDSMLHASFWTFLVSSIIFVLRKTVKWKYFYLNQEGKQDYRPWVNTKDKFKLFDVMMKAITKEKVQVLANEFSSQIGVQAKLNDRIAS